jgi:hypothetical protein
MRDSILLRRIVAICGILNGDAGLCVGSPFPGPHHLKVARILPTTVKTRTTAALWDRYPIGFYRGPRVRPSSKFFERCDAIHKEPWNSVRPCFPPFTSKIPINALRLAAGFHQVRGPGGNIAVLDGPDGAHGGRLGRPRAGQGCLRGGQARWSEAGRAADQCALAFRPREGQRGPNLDASRLGWVGGMVSAVDRILEF